MVVDYSANHGLKAWQRDRLASDFTYPIPTRKIQWDSRFTPYSHLDILIKSYKNIIFYRMKNTILNNNYNIFLDCTLQHKIQSNNNMKSYPIILGFSVLYICRDIFVN